MPIRNPFRASIDSPALLGRDDERRRALRALTDPAAKLLILAPRRMGKTSLLRAAASDARSTGSLVLIADLAGISCLTDVASRLLRAAATEISQSWPDATGELVRRLAIKVALEADPQTGAILPSLDPALRRAPLEEQHVLLRRVLDTLDELARTHDTRLGIALDEIQELFRHGGNSADWALASAARQHSSLCYLLASSAETASSRSPPSDRSPLSLFEPIYLGPLPEQQIAAWIDEQLRLAGVKPQDTGNAIARIGGYKLANVAQMAAYCFDTVRSAGFAREGDVATAFSAAIEDCGDITRSIWESLTTHQQNVLRALAVKSYGLTTAATRDRFSLGDTGTTHNSAQLLLRKGILERLDGGYVYESPFVRGWVIAHALSDVGISLPVTHVPHAREH